MVSSYVLIFFPLCSAHSLQFIPEILFWSHQSYNYLEKQVIIIPILQIRNNTQEMVIEAKPLRALGIKDMCIPISLIETWSFIYDSRLIFISCLGCTIRTE